MRAWASDVSSVSLNNSFCSRPEALDEGILHGLARRDVVLCYAALIDPLQEGIAGQLAAADHHLRLAALHHRPVRFPRDPDTNAHASRLQKRSKLLRHAAQAMTSPQHLTLDPVNIAAGQIGCRIGGQRVPGRRRHCSPRYSVRERAPGYVSLAKVSRSSTKA